MTTWRDGSSGSRPHRDLEDRAHTIDTGAALPTLPDALYGAGTVFVRTTDYSEWITDGAAWHPLASDDLSFYPDGGVTGPYMCEDANVSLTLTSGTVFVACFQATQTVEVGAFITCFGGSMANTTASRLALYEIGVDGTLTLIARNTFLTPGWQGGWPILAFNTGGGYPATYTLTRGYGYGVGIVQAGSTGTPVIRCKDHSNTIPAVPSFGPFPRCYAITAQTDCPTTILPAPQSPTGRYVPWIGLV